MTPKDQAELIVRRAFDAVREAAQNVVDAYDRFEREELQLDDGVEQSIDALRSALSAPVPSPDGAVQRAINRLREYAATWDDCTDTSKPSLSEDIEIVCKASISTLATGAAEPVAEWTVRVDTNPADDDFPDDKCWEVRLPDGTWGGCVAVDADDARATMQKSWAEDHPDATPPVRGDREAIKEADRYFDLAGEFGNRIQRAVALIDKFEKARGVDKSFASELKKILDPEAALSRQAPQSSSEDGAEQRTNLHDVKRIPRS